MKGLKVNSKLKGERESQSIQFSGNQYNPSMTFSTFQPNKYIIYAIYNTLCHSCGFALSAEGAKNILTLNIFHIFF